MLSTFLRVIVLCFMTLEVRGICEDGSCPASENVMLQRSRQKLTAVQQEGLEAASAVKLQEVHASMTPDGDSATVSFEHEGTVHTYDMSQDSLYSSDAEVWEVTEDGEEELDPGDSDDRSGVFAARSVDSARANARVDRDGNVYGLFEVDGSLVQIRSALEHDVAPSLLQTYSGNTPAHVVLPYFPSSLQGRPSWAHRRNKTSDPDGDDADEEEELFVDWVEKPDELLYKSAHQSSTKFKGDKFYPGCYSGDHSPHVLTVGFTSDVEAYRKYGNNVRKVLENILLESAFVYEGQLNIKLQLAYMKNYKSASSTFLNSCSEESIDKSKLAPFRSNRPSKKVGAHHLFTGCGPSYGMVGVAYMGSVCKQHNLGVTKLRGAGTFDTYAHELGHNFGAAHSFEEGKFKTGGIMDYGDGELNGAYQFNRKHRRSQMCKQMKQFGSRCQSREFSKFTSGGSQRGSCRRVTKVSSGKCPSSPHTLPNCKKAQSGALCEGDGECGTDPRLNNCGAFDVYRKS